MDNLDKLCDSLAAIIEKKIDEYFVALEEIVRDDGRGDLSRLRRQRQDIDELRFALAQINSSRTRQRSKVSAKVLAWEGGGGGFSGGGASGGW